jgi:hypothetical protein
MTVVTGTIETDFKVTEQERLEFKALHKLHETEEYLKTSIRGLHTFLTIDGDVAILGMLVHGKGTNIRVNLVSGKAKSGTYEQGKPFSMTDNRMNELEDAITSYFKA